MLTICRAYVRSGVEAVSDIDIEAVGARAYDWVDSISSELSEIEATGVKIQVREGSLTLIGVILGIAGAVYTAITRYDEFWSGLERLRQHARSVALSIEHRFRNDPTLGRGPILSSKVSMGALDKIHRLGEEVRAGRLLPDHAAQEVLRTLRSAGEPIDSAMIAGVEEALGARRLGTQRLEIMAVPVHDERHVRVTGRGAPPRLRRRRLTISRGPGSTRPTVRFDHD